MTDEPGDMIDEPLSPELALVCPELAERARAALPERPWEAFLPPPVPTPAPAAVPEAPPAPETIVPPPVVSVPAPRPQPLPQRRRRRRIPITPLVVAGLAIVVTVAGYLPASDAPVLVDGPPVEGTRPEPGTYADGTTVRLEVAADGTLTGTVVSLACGAAGPLTGRIGPSGGFRGSVATTVSGRRITGSVSGRRTGDELRGLARLRTGSCDSGPVPFSAIPVAEPDE